MSGCVTDTPSVSLTIDGGVLEADVNISPDAGNELSEHANGLYAAGAPSGAIMFYAGAAAPAGWLLCDGSAILRASYAALFAEIGTTYGNGNGTTTFNLPDLRGRVPVGLGSNTDCDALGDTEGEAVANRSPKHLTSSTLGVTKGTLGVDTSGLQIPANDDGSTSGANRVVTTDHGQTTTAPVDGVATVTGAPTLTGSVGPGGSRPTDTPAFLTLNGIIKT